MAARLPDGLGTVDLAKCMKPDRPLSTPTYRAAMTPINRVFIRFEALRLNPIPIDNTLTDNCVR